MSSYATYCEDHAADCARRARLATSPEVAIYCRRLGLRWLRLAEQAQGAAAPGWTHDATLRQATRGDAKLAQATPPRLVTKARPF